MTLYRPIKHTDILQEPDVSIFRVKTKPASNQQAVALASAESLKMKATYSSDTSAKFCHSTRCHTPEDFPLHIDIFQWLSYSDVRVIQGGAWNGYLIESWNKNFNIRVMVQIHLWMQRTMGYTLSMIDILLCTFGNMDASVCDHLTAHVLHNLPTYSNNENPEFHY